MRFRSGAVIVLYVAGSLQLFAAVSGYPPRAKRLQHPAQRVAPSSPIGHTPLERELIPWAQKHLHPLGAVNQQNANSDAPFAQSAVPGAPNFGGFLNGRAYDDGLETKCAAAPDNCGIAYALSGDFDGDGKQDLATIQNDGTVYMLLNDGSGGLKAPVTYAPPSSLNPSNPIGYATSADLNGDGYPDIVYADVNDTAFVVYLNKKDGTFSAPVSIPVNTPDYAELDAIGVADVNGDGKLDVVALLDSLNFNGPGPVTTNLTIQTFTGNGDGTFATPTAAQTSVQVIPQALFGPSLAFGDLHHSGKLDLVFLTAVFDSSNFFADVSAAVAKGNGDGTFQPFTSAIVEQGVFPQFRDVQVLDLNADGNLDIAFNGSLDLYIALGNGDGTFQPQFNTYLLPIALKFADLNGDGYPDLVMNGNGVLAVYPGNGDGNFGTPPAEYIDANDTPQGISIADYNGDGIPDIVEVSNDPRIATIFLGQGGDRYAAAPLLSSPSNPVIDASQLELQAAGDFTGDGYTDIVALNTANGQPSLEAAISDGKGGFSYKTALPANAFGTLSYVQPVTADFNGDGKQDIILTGSVGTLAVALSNGDGTFGSPVKIPLGPLDCIPNYAAVSDLTHSGHQDIVITYAGDFQCGGSGYAPSGYFIIPGNGDGTFGAPQFTPFGVELFSVAIADMNGDGIPDLLLNDLPFDFPLAAFNITFVAGNGDDTFREPLIASYGNVISQISIGDFDQDGKPDLVLFSQGAQGAHVLDSSAGIQLYRGHGDGYFDPWSQLAVGNFYENGFLGDVNGDGIPDITAALNGVSSLNNNFEGLVTWLGLGGGYFSSVSTYLPRGSTTLAAGQFLPDRTTSFVVQNSDILAATIMLNQGGDSLSLSASSSSPSQGDTVTFSASVSTTFSNGAPTGTVAFSANGASLGTATIDGGMATFSTNALAVGANPIIATYSGDGHYNVATATETVTVSALQPAIAISSTPASLTLQPGATGTVTLNVAANAAFSGTVTLSCSGAPTESSCNINPSTVQLVQGQSATVTAVISTTAPNNTYQASRGQSPVDSLRAASSIGLAAALLLMLPMRRRLPRIFMVFLAVLLMATVGLTGCGGGNKTTVSAPTYSGTPTGSYSLTVTATSGLVSSTTPITLKVQ